MRNQSQRDLDAFQEIGQLFPTIFVCIYPHCIWLESLSCQWKYPCCESHVCFFKYHRCCWKSNFGRFEPHFTDSWTPHVTCLLPASTQWPVAPDNEGVTWPAKPRCYDTACTRLVIGGDQQFYQPTWVKTSNEARLCRLNMAKPSTETRVFHQHADFNEWWETKSIGGEVAGCPKAGQWIRAHVFRKYVLQRITAYMFWKNTLEWGSNQDLNQTSWNFMSGFPTQDTSVIIVDFRFIPSETNNTMKIQTIYWIYRSIDPRTNQINYHALRLTWENSGNVWHILTFNQSYMDCSLLRMIRCTLSLSFQLWLLRRVMCSCVEYIILCHTRHINIMCRWYFRSPPCVWEGTRVLFP